MGFVRRQDLAAQLASLLRRRLICGDALRPRKAGDSISCSPLFTLTTTSRSVPSRWGLEMKLLGLAMQSSHMSGT